MQILAHVDINIFFLLNNLAGRFPFTDFLIVFFAHYIAFIIPIIFLIFLYQSTYPLREKFLVASVVLLSSLFARLGVVELIRLFYHRPRPFLIYDVHKLLPENSYSFPSGHATLFFAFAYAVYLYNKKLGIWLFALTILMTTARVIAGVHYPSDVLAGILLGSVVAYVTFRYAKPSFKKIINRLISFG